MSALKTADLVESWFNTSAFDFSGNCPAPGLLTPTGPFDTAKAFGKHHGTSRPGGILASNNLDFSVQKDFDFPGEQTRLQFRADFFNLPNHPQFAEPVGDLTNGNFGSITRTTTGNRTIQLGLHLFF